MNKLIFRVFVFVCALMIGAQSVIADDYAAFSAADWNWLSVGNDGALCGKAAFSDLFGGPQVISIVKYPENALSTSLVYNAGSDNAKTTSATATQTAATVAINGSYFNMSTHVTTVPLWCDSSMVTTNTDATRSTGIVGFTSTGGIGFETSSPAAYESLRAKYKSFIASGPLLRLNGENQTIPTVDESFDGLNPRSMIGVTADRVVYMVVVDGRNAGVAAGVTVAEMQQLAEWLGLTDAINLDGGGSSTLWAVGQGVINRPSGGAERVMPTVIVAKDRSGNILSTPDLVDGYYEIGTAEQLFWFAEQVNKGYSGLNAKLTADINLNNQDWTPIGTGTVQKETYTATTAFSGNFDGQGHTISGLNVSQPQLAGFIGYYNGTGYIGNFKIEGSVQCTNTVTTDQCMAGGVIAYCKGACTIEDIWSKVNVSTLAVANQRAAGIVARLNGAAKINRCRFSATASAPSFVAGGITAFPPSSGIKITNCLFDGAITKTTGYAGGIVGYNNNTGVVISNCLSLGENIDYSGSSNIGAIVGKTSTINAGNNYYTGTKYGVGTMNPAPIKTTAAELANGATLAKLAAMTANSSGLYPSDSPSSSWTQDFASAQAYPVPSDTGFVCTHNANPCTFCSGQGSTTIDLKAGEKFECDGIFYVVNDDLATVYVTYPGASAPASAGSNSYSGAVSIPSTVEYGGKAYRVTSIGDNAFRYATITSISIAEGITSVGQYAIRNCESLPTIEFPNSCVEFGRTCVESAALKSVIFGNGAIKIGDNFGRLCTGITDVTFNSTTPPTVATYFFNYSRTLTVHVPASALTAYKAKFPQEAYPNFSFAIIGADPAALQAAIAEYTKLIPAADEIGTDPGYYSAVSVNAFKNILSSAAALGENASSIEISDAMRDIMTAYEALYVYPLNEGIYYINNVYKPQTALYADSDNATTQGLKISAFDAIDNRFYFRLTKNGANWDMQCIDNNFYVGTTIDGSGTDKYISLTQSATNPLVIALVKSGQFTIKPTYANGTAAPTIRSFGDAVTTYTYAATDPNVVRAYWQFHPVASDKFEQSFDLENPRVRAYMDAVNYTTSSASKITTYNVAPPARRDQPSPVTIFWQRDTTSCQQRILWGLSPDFAPSVGVDVDNQAASYELYNLIPGNTYYYKVVAIDAEGTEKQLQQSSFTTTGQVRMIKADNIANVRDLGGWPTASSKPIAYGRIFRGAALSSSTITQTDIDAMLSVGIRAELDLRSDSEAGNITASLLGPAVTYKRIPLGQTSTYYAGLTDYKSQYKKDVEYVFDCVANDIPVYFHCAIGADRTGTLAFLLEGLLGVSESDLYRDYELTTLSGQTRTKTYLDTDVINLIKSLKGTTLQEKFQTYFTQNLGISQSAISQFIDKMLYSEPDPIDPPAEGVTRVMTYSIKHCSTGVNTIANTICSQHPHIVALQDVDSLTDRSGRINQAEQLAQMTHMQATFCKTVDCDGGSCGIAILSNEQPLSVRHMPLSADTEEGMMLIIELENYYMACVYLGPTTPANLQSVRLICQEAARGNKPFVIAGNFNDPDKIVYNELQKYFTIFSDLDQPTSGEAPQHTCTDYIACYNTLGGVELQQYQVVDDITSSDHRPAWADLVIDDNPTFINHSPSADTPDSKRKSGIYTIEGKIITRDANNIHTLNHLPAGIYIVNGETVNIITKK